MEVNDIRRSLMAAMETGNQGAARTMLREVQEENPEVGRELQMEIIDAYGVML